MILPNGMEVRYIDYNELYDVYEINHSTIDLSYNSFGLIRINRFSGTPIYNFITNVFSTE